VRALIVEVDARTDESVRVFANSLAGPVRSAAVTFAARSASPSAQPR
jgi:hypothetical protein